MPVGDSFLHVNLTEKHTFISKSIAFQFLKKVWVQLGN